MATIKILIGKKIATPKRSYLRLLIFGGPPVSRTQHQRIMSTSEWSLSAF